jgi:hypothetical protein
MSSITNINNSGYYQMSDLSAGAGGGTTQTTLADPLLQALSSEETQGTSSSSDAYLLDLSSAAQDLLNGTGSTDSTSSTSDALDPSSSQSFVLTTQQQQTITNILEKYKDAPYTQATFDEIQNDLQAAGLDPTTLSREDEAQSFNPTQLFIDDLNGDYSDADAMTNPDESTKSSNYMQQILSQWQEISGNTGMPASASDSTSGTSLPTSSTSAS